ncbi:protein FAM117A isoform X3 [Pipra filicauda]|uniref:Protein FAM117A isoform X3 n=1 Tax=Pipra filicauda TaxID=649802 RepID=A0A7R5L0E7_9PASS|nr:protein FAM117A isoform X3 [Pipra filicauda]
MAGVGAAPSGRAGPGGLHPLRATVPFQLQQRRGDGARAASVPCAMALEQPGRSRRTCSLDPLLGSYLLGQWPRDRDTPPCTRDKATQPCECPEPCFSPQTPQSWPEAAAGPGSARGGSEHRREIAKLKQQLQRTKLSGRNGKEREKSCPFPGDHTLRGSLQDSPSGFPSPCPVLRLSPCLHRSLEGLNQELEEVFVREQGDEELLRILDVPDGHRAPAPAQPDPLDTPLDTPLALEPGSGSWNSLSLSPSPSLQSPGRPSEAQPEPKEKAAPAHPSLSSLPARTRTRFTSPPQAPPSAPFAWCSRSSRMWDSSSGASRLPLALARAPSPPASPPRPPRLPPGIASPGSAARPRRASCSRAPSWRESLGKGGTGTSGSSVPWRWDVAAPGIGNGGRIPPRMAETGKDNVPWIPRCRGARSWSLPSPKHFPGLDCPCSLGEEQRQIPAPLGMRGSWEDSGGASQHLLSLLGLGRRGWSCLWKCQAGIVPAQLWSLREGGRAADSWLCLPFPAPNLEPPWISWTLCG